MTSAMGSTLPWASLLLLACVVAVTAAAAATAQSGQLFGKINRIPALQEQLFVFRGGDNEEYDPEEYDSEYDSEEEDEPIVSTAKKLASSTKSATQKKALQETAVKTAAIKSKVSVAMASSSTISKAVTKKRGIYKRFVPYIVRACLNPFTLIAMTKAYFVSLMDINYLKEVSENHSASCDQYPDSCVFREPRAFAIYIKRLACVEVWNIEFPTRQPSRFVETVDL